MSAPLGQSLRVTDLVSGASGSCLTEVPQPLSCLLLCGAVPCLQISQLRNDFRASQQAGTTWQVLGNTVVMGPLNTPDVESAAQRQGPVAETLLQVSVAQTVGVI